MFLLKNVNSGNRVTPSKNLPDVICSNVLTTGNRETESPIGRIEARIETRIEARIESGIESVSAQNPPYNKTFVGGIFPFSLLPENSA